MCFRFSARLTLERRIGADFLREKMVGSASVLRGFNIRLDPSSRTSMRYDCLKQCSSKCFEHKRGFFGKDVLPIAWIHAWRNSLSFGNVWNRIFGSFCFFGLNVALKGYTVWHFCCFRQTTGEQSNQVTSQAHTAPRDQSRWRRAGDLNNLEGLLWTPKKVYSSE